MNKGKTFLMVVLFASVVSAGGNTYDFYIHYSQELHFRVGVNKGAVGVFARPIFDKHGMECYYPENEYVNKKQIGMEAGINLNRLLFSYKKAEMIVNVFGGYSLSRIEWNYTDKQWEKVFVAGVNPEIRLFKKASLNICPIIYRYYLPIKSKNSNGASIAYFPSMRLMDFSMGITLYY